MKIIFSYHFLWFFSQNWRFRLENENFEIFRNSAYTQIMGVKILRSDWFISQARSSYWLKLPRFSYLPRLNPKVMNCQFLNWFKPFLEFLRDFKFGILKSFMVFIICIYQTDFEFKFRILGFKHFLNVHEYI